MSSTLLLPPRAQLCNRSCSNKTPLGVIGTAVINTRCGSTSINTHTTQSHIHKAVKCSRFPTLLLPPRAQLCNRSCSNKTHTFHAPSHAPLLLPLLLLVWYVPSLRYTRGLGWRMHCGAEVTESSTNKQHHHHPLLLATLLSHTSLFPRVHWCVVVSLVHTSLGSSYLIAHVLHYPPPPTHTALY